MISILCANLERRSANRFFAGAQIAGAAAMSFMHGAQDGQKFIGVLFLGLAFSNGQSSVSGMEIPIADLAGAFCLLLSSLFGIPVSTTHTKTSAIMGVGAVKRITAINFNVVKDMMLTWVFTFPGCGIISFVMAKLFMYLM